jgi:hypothetical protein
MKKLLLCENGKFKNCFVRGGWWTCSLQIPNLLF